MTKFPFLLLLLFFLNINCEGQTSPVKSKPSADKSALLLGVYHFSNPGQDTYNIEVDDYFSDKRQSEIEEVVNLLEAYQPTKIFVEFSPASQARMDSLYQLYLKDKIELSELERGENEVYQIGFRLGKKMGGVDIEAVDHDGYWLGSYADFIADTLSLDYYVQDRENQAAEIEKRQAAFSTNTVRQNLSLINEWEQLLDNHNYYNNVAVRVKDTMDILFTYQEEEQNREGVPYLMRSFDFNNIGIELVAEWYKRNLFIYRNILENTKEGDRALIIFGAGHMRYLHQMLQDNPEFKLVPANQYLK